MIEILVALLILTLGLMAMISLHTASVRYHKISEFRGIASQLAEDYADRMRANLTGVRDGSYIRNVAWSADLQRINEPGCATANACTPGEIAARDIAQWVNNAVGNLPGAGLYAVRPPGAAANSAVMDVWVVWLDPTTNAGDAAADNLINAGFACPPAMGAVPGELRCLYYRFML